MGFFCGILLSTFIFVVEIYLKPRGIGVSQIKRIVEQKTQMKGSVFFPVPDAVRSVEEKVRENEKRGVDTEIDQILQ